MFAAFCSIILDLYNVYTLLNVEPGWDKFTWPLLDSDHLSALALWVTSGYRFLGKENLKLKNQRT